MQLGMIGLGRIGANMVRRLLKNGQACVVFDRSPGPVNERFSSRGEADYADRLLSAMRFGFGGHLEKQQSKAA